MQLSLPAHCSSKQGLAALSALTALQSLSLQNSRIHSLRDLDTAIAGLVQLTCLDLSRVTFFLDDSLDHISRLTKLKYGAHETSTCCSACINLCSSASLSWVLYDGDRFLSLEAAAGHCNSILSETGLAGLSSLQLLENLNLSGRYINNMELPCIARCTRLKRLVLECTQVSDQGLLALSGLSGLSVLRLSRQAIYVLALHSEFGMPADLKCQCADVLQRAGLEKEDERCMCQRRG